MSGPDLVTELLAAGDPGNQKLGPSRELYRRAAAELSTLRSELDRLDGLESESAEASDIVAELNAEVVTLRSRCEMLEAEVAEYDETNRQMVRSCDILRAARDEARAARDEAVRALELARKALKPFAKRAKDATGPGYMTTVKDEWLLVARATALCTGRESAPVGP